MSFLERALEEPSYGFRRGEALYIPSTRELWGEFFGRLNVLRTRKNWLALFGWTATLALLVPLALFLRFHFSWPLVVLGFVYSMVVLGSHGTVWLHRYATHRAYRFRRPLFAAVCRNLVIKIVPEEIYVVSHHVHHRYAELPGDPYNARAGWLYCFLADVNHQPIRKDLTPAEYARVCGMLDHTGVRANSYRQYLKWGSVCHPGLACAHYALNWLFWYAAFYAIGGHAVALALFGSAAVWGLGVRTFNFAGHGGGKDKRREGIDFNSRDRAINQLWPGFVAGEWHSNHHLYPGSARTGFLPYQIDLPWYFIALMAKGGIVSSYRDSKADFLRECYAPYWEKRASAAADEAPKSCASSSSVGPT